MNQKRFANIALIVLVVVIIGAVGYFAFVKKSATPSETQQPIIPSSNTTITPTLPSDTSIKTVPSPKPSRIEYPFSIYPLLSQGELSKRKDIFRQRNNLTTDQGDVDLDERGGFARQVTLHNTSLTNYSEEKMKDFILKNKDFFGIDDEKTFNLYKLSLLPEREPVLIAQKPLLVENIQRDVKEFGNDLVALQKIDGRYFDYPFRGPEYGLIRVYDSNPSIVIAGHFFPYPVLPAKPRVPEQEILRKLVGTTYSYSVSPCGGAACPPGSKTEYYTLTVEQKDLSVEVMPKAFPQPDGFELRLGYEVTFLKNNIIYWTKFFDAVTGHEGKDISRFPPIKVPSPQ